MTLFARKNLAEKQTSQGREKKKETPSESTVGLAGVFVSALFIVTFVVQPFEIPSGSMEQTMLVGDHLLVDRITPTRKAGYMGPLVPYREIRRGDIIVFVHPDPAQKGIYVVKRVIGIPHDRIRLRNGVVYRNGEALNEPYVSRKRGNHDDYRDEFPRYSAAGLQEVPNRMQFLQIAHTPREEFLVPLNTYFSMGDHLDKSLDSRYWGFIPRENIGGRPM